MDSEDDLTSNNHEAAAEADEPSAQDTAEPAPVVVESNDDENVVERPKAELSPVASTSESPQAPGEKPPEKRSHNNETKGLQSLLESALVEDRNMKKNPKSSPERRVSVTIDRKKILLMEAREKRNLWVSKVPAPYKKPRNLDEPWLWDQRLSSFGSTHAVKKIPSTLSVLSLMYRMGDELSIKETTDRINALLELEMEYDEQAIVSLADEVQEELASKECDSYLKSYNSFWRHLLDPACAMLVQGMRNFCRKLKDVSEKEEISARLRSYIASTFQSLQSHPVWKKNGADDGVRRALEAFIYGQCYTYLESILWTAAAEQRERDWIMRLSDLQFATPHHLEIACLCDYDSIDLEALLKEATESLRSVDLYYSAYDKLQRILAVYHSVNTALTTALNRHQPDGSKKKLPSADDVLPTIILTVLRSKPERLHLNLELVEDFSPPEYLRGEAGYAFTNLYGAVQFLLDLDLEDPKSLSISPEEFREGLRTCREKSERRLQNALASTSPENPEIMPLSTMDIPPIEIRKARQRGENIGVDWALQWQAVHGQEHSEKLGACSEQGASEDFMEDLPPGFTRSYSFLTARAEDVKLSDLPKLLEEYRMLVHATESLLGERAARTKAERKAKRRAAEQALYARVQDVDPLLLPTMNGTNK